MVPKNLMIVIAIAAALTALVLPANGQQPVSQCTPAMLTSVGPCMNFLTNSSSNATSPSTQCCNSLKNLTSGGMGCLCLIVTGTLPFRIPINRTTAVSLPRACNMPRVPVQCQANVAPAAAPGPASLGPALSPSPAAAPVVPEPTPSAQPPVPDATPPLAPSTPTADGGAPTESTGGSSRPSLNPSSAFRSTYSLSPSLVLFVLGLVVLKFY